MASRGGLNIQFKDDDSDVELYRKLRALASVVEDLIRDRSTGGTTTTVTNTVLPTMGSPRLLGRATGTGAPQELSPAQVNLLLPTFQATVQGLVPSPGIVTGLRFLADDGSWKLISFDLGTIQHGTLAGLENDDHPQYLLRADVRDLMHDFLFLGA